jgi:uncharacterized protein (TIGR01777 family)
VKVAVTGSSGLIGSQLCARLESAGHEVARIVRQGAAPGGWTLSWDPDKGVVDQDSLEGFDAVVHLAGAGVADHRWTPERKRIVRESRTRGTALIASALANLRHPPRVLVSASAIGYYGDRGDEALDETSSPGQDFLAQVCQDWEAAAGPALNAGVRTVFARTGLVLAGQGGALPKLVRLFQLGLGGPLGSGSQWWSWVSIEDEVGALVWVLDNDCSGPVNITAPSPVTNREFARALGRVLHKPAWLRTPRLGPELLLGKELAAALLFTSAKVYPAVLQRAGYPFGSTKLDMALPRILGAA